jgi:hypothetical protein
MAACQAKRYALTMVWLEEFGIINTRDLLVWALVVNEIELTLLAAGPLRVCRFLAADDK